MTEPKRFLTREDVEAKKELRREEVYVPEWGGWMIVQEMTASERDAFEAQTMKIRREVMRDGTSRVTGADYDQDFLTNLRARLCVETCITEQGQRLFNAGDIGWVGERSASALDRVFDISSRLSGLSVRDIESLTRGLPKTPNGASAIDSP